MEINGINYSLDPQLIEDCQKNYSNNIKLFEQQNTGLIINHVEKLYEDDIIKFVANNLGKNLEEKEVLIDNKFIDKHFINFAINPEIIEFEKNYTMQVDIVPDIICESIKL